MPEPERGAAAVDSLAIAHAAARRTPLGDVLARAIESGGPITFAEFMRRALYEPRLGYYRRPAATVGRDGDFLTSPELHPIFGSAVAAVVAATWDALGNPTPFLLREYGPGSGALVAALMRWLRADRPECAAALRVELVEPADLAAARQRETLEPLAEQVDWVNAPQDPAHVVLANELLDAQPAHRLRWNGAEWEELWVTLDATGGFRDEAGPLSDAALIEPLGAIAPAAGQTVEVCPGARGVVADLAAGLDHGLLLLFDYGYPRERLYAPWRSAGTLMSFHRHTPGEDPFLRVGEQDLSVHVDLDTVREAALAAGLRPYPQRTQAEFLQALGAALLPPVAAGGSGPQLDAYLAARRAVEALTDPGGLGRIAVMAFARGALGELPGVGPPE